ncbi:MAG: NAD(P)-binding protein, partial [Hyphomicrobiales bacterium]
MGDIVRRDFLNGVALTIAAGLTPARQAMAQPLRYPPALTGLRGDHGGSFEAAHDLRDGKAFAFDRLPVEESYDLIVVGGGISGLAAAWFYRKMSGGAASILILDNHDDFGGHAKRNEFRLDGRLILGYGGSESLQSPKGLYSDVAKGLIAELGIDIARFETAFERDLYPSLGLSRGVFFPRESFSRDVLVAGDPMTVAADDIAPERRNAKPIRDFISAFPVSAASKAQLIALFEQNADPLPGKSLEEKLAVLEKTSYRDYLVKLLGCADEVANCFQGRTHDIYALGCDALAAAEAREAGLPGFDGLGLPKPSNPDLDEPYIYHFPDGNASLARLLVRSLIPAAAPGAGMEDVVLAPFDYGRLDAEGAPMRLRLDSMCVQARSGAGGAEVAYLREGKLHLVAGKHAVLACFNMMIPYLMPELPQEQRAA